MIRPAALVDISSILGMALIETKRYPRLKSDAEKMRKVIIHIISSAKHFCWVSENGHGKVTGVLVAIANENMWAQRQSCNVVMWTSKVVGDGVKLLRKVKQWVCSRRAIKVVGFAPDTNDVDPRAWRLAELMGFEKCGGAYLLYN